MDKLAIFPVGGESTRMDADVPKWMLKLPNNKTIIETSVQPYVDAGYNILFLARHKDVHAARTLLDLFDAEVRMDPVAKVGRGGALKHAWELIKDHELVVIHNPDDVVLNNVTPTIDWFNRGNDCCFARTVSSIPHPYTTFDMNRHKQVKRVMRHSRVWQPAHIGITILCGLALQYIAQLPDTPCDFESIAFPRMRKTGQLFGHELTNNEDWYSCNDKKTYELLCHTLEEDND